MKDKIVSNGDLEPSRDSRVSSYEWNPWAFVPGFRQLLSVFPQGSADQDNDGNSKGK